MFISWSTSTDEVRHPGFAEDFRDFREKEVNEGNRFANPFPLRHFALPRWTDAGMPLELYYGYREYYHRSCCPTKPLPPITAAAQSAAKKRAARQSFSSVENVPPPPTCCAGQLVSAKIGRGTNVQSVPQPQR